MIDGTHASEVLQFLLHNNFVAKEDTTLIIIDGNQLSANLKAVQKAFPKHFHHTAAIKACPLVGVVNLLPSLDFGVEAASQGELAIALNAGVPPHQIVFDSPVKTESEMQWLEGKGNGFRVNLDSLEELGLHRKRGFPFEYGLRITVDDFSDSVSYLNVSGEE